VKYVAVALVLFASTPAIADDGETYLLPHPDAKWWLSGQLNVIGQAQPGFHAPYSGENSFRSNDNTALSFVATIYAGYAITPTTAFIIAPESAGGTGLSDALGLAGFTNLDVVRNPSLGAAPYIGRLIVDQIIPLSEDGDTSRDPLHILRRPPRRIEIRAGKFGTVDVFDQNAVGTDSHLQFMNWTVDNNGAYDYAADTRGYTLGVIIEYIAPLWAVRFGEMLMPKVANGIDYDFDIANARGEQLELEIHECIAGYPGIVRILGYLNHANMGSYAEAIAAFRTGIDDVPDVTKYRVPGRTKHGGGISVEHEMPGATRGFLRLGWNDGNNESFAYTEVDNTILVGGDVRGDFWHRPNDKLGLAFVTNGLSDLHATYLALGGKGFLLGDGKLNYGREDIIESYYTARVYRGVYPAADIQFIEHPGYNRDRGPVVVGSLRLHVEL
jgi:high affinity Mn2+ porin